MRRNRTTALPQYVIAAHKNQGHRVAQECDRDNSDQDFDSMRDIRCDQTDTKA